MYSYVWCNSFLTRLWHVHDPFIVRVTWMTHDSFITCLTCVWHDVISRVMWLIRDSFMTDFSCVWRVWPKNPSFQVWCDILLRVTWLISDTSIPHSSCVEWGINDPWLIHHTCDICVTWRISMCDVTHLDLFMTHSSCVWHERPVTHSSHVWHAVFLRVMWLICDTSTTRSSCVWPMTHSSHAWHVCDMTWFHVWCDSVVTH